MVKNIFDFNFLLLFINSIKMCLIFHDLLNKLIKAFEFMKLYIKTFMYLMLNHLNQELKKFFLYFFPVFFFLIKKIKEVLFSLEVIELLASHQCRIQIFYIL